MANKDPVTDYAKSVLSDDPDRPIHGPHVRNACQRHLDDLKRKDLIWNFYGDNGAERVFWFFKKLSLAGGQFEGLPFKLEPSQQFIIGSLFGWKRQDGSRRFRRAYIEEGKGNGKSPLAAGIGLYMMMADREPRAEIYAAARKKEQAMVLFRDAVAMRQQSDGLRACLKTSGANPVWQLTDMRTGSFFKCLASEEGQSGPKPHCGLCDEIHEMADANLLTMIEAGFKWRRQPLLVMTTNSGHDRKSVCYEQHSRAVRVAAGTRTPDDKFSYVGEVIDDSTFSFVCGLNSGDDPLEDETCWAKANPLLNVTMTDDKLRETVKQAKLIPSRRNEVLRLNFCVWTDAESTWMSREALEACLANFDPVKENAGKKVCVGVDLSATQDLTALGFVVQNGTKEVRREDGGVEHLPTYDAWVEAFTPEDTIKERGLRDRAPYEAWAQQGFLHAVPGKYIRKEYVVARLAEIASHLDIEWLAYDQYSFRDFAEKMDEAGLTIKTIWHPQGGVRRARCPDEEHEAAKRAGQQPPPGLWMPGSLGETEALILDQRIRIKRNPVLISALMSAVIMTDNLMNNRWLSKQKATNRIDPAVSLIMAVGAATRVPTKAVGPSVYETTGFII